MGWEKRGSQTQILAGVRDAETKTATRANEPRSPGWGEARKEGDCEKLRRPVLVMKNVTFMVPGFQISFIREVENLRFHKYLCFYMLATNSVFLTVAQIQHITYTGLRGSSVCDRMGIG